MAKTTTQITKKTTGTKRKHEDSQSPDDNEKNNTTTTTTHTPKKSKLSKSPQTPSTSDSSISTLHPTTLSQKFTTTIQKHTPSITTIELEDLTLAPTSFTDTTTFSLPRSPANLSKFLIQYTEGGTTTLTATPEKATPHTLILTSSAIRCTELLRGVRDLGTSNSKIAKLFAKHMKLAAMQKYVRDTAFGIGAGTPGRILDLAKSGVLKTEGLRRVVIDGSYVDQKGRTVWDEGETFLRVVEIVNLEGVKGGLVRGDVEVLVF